MSRTRSSGASSDAPVAPFAHGATGALAAAPPHNAGPPRRGAAHPGLRLRVYFERRELDRQLAAGRRWDTGAALALRARQLTDPRARSRLAASLRATVDFVERSGSGREPCARVPSGEPLSRGRRAVNGLADRLEGAGPVNPRGIVLARALLSGGVNPLRSAHCGQTVSEAVSEVEAALDVDGTGECPARPGSTGACGVVLPERLGAQVS